MIESSQLQTQISVMLDQHLPQVAYQLKLNSQGQITWLDYQTNGQVIEYDKDREPAVFREQ